MKNQNARPSIDHGILSPSGKVSKRAREAFLKREHNRLFPEGYWDAPEKTEHEKALEKIESLERHAARLRDLADRGMSAKKFRRQADEADAEIAALRASL